MDFRRIERAFWASSIALILSVLAGTAAGAADSGGISGYLLDRAGRPMRHATVIIFRPSDWCSIRVSTDGRGFFGAIDLEPGRYYVAVLVRGAVSGYLDACAVRDVVGGEQDRVTLHAGQCSEDSSTLHSLVDPNGTADVYRIR